MRRVAAARGRLPAQGLGVVGLDRNPACYAAEPHPFVAGLDLETAALTRAEGLEIRDVFWFISHKLIYAFICFSLLPHHEQSQV